MTNTTKAVLHALEIDDFDSLRTLLESESPAGIAHVLGSVKEEEKLTRLFDVLHKLSKAGDVLYELSAKTRALILKNIAPVQIALYISKLNTNHAGEILESISDKDMHKVLRIFPRNLRIPLLKYLGYRKKSVGKIMHTSFLTAYSNSTVRYFLSTQQKKPKAGKFHDIFTLDTQGHLLGTCSMYGVMCSDEDRHMFDLSHPIEHSFSVNTPLHEVSQVFQQTNTSSLPVVDKENKLVGIINADDILHLVEEEADENLLCFFGVQKDDIDDSIFGELKKRVIWLSVSLTLSFIVGAVVNIFHASISSIAFLAALMPIAAAMGGTATGQTTAIMVRALATIKDHTKRDFINYVLKETRIGMINGVMFCLPIALVTFLWSGNFLISVSISVAIIINMSMAGLCGTLVPLLLHRAKFDPAIGSCIFVNALTDIIGLGSFLFMANLLIF